MKQIKVYKKGTPQGDIEMSIAFKGKLIAIKGKDNPTAHQFIEQYRKKGAIVIEKRSGVVVNFFKPGQTLYKIGQIEIDFEKDSDSVIESKLCAFYIETFSKAGFEVE